jgi:outer membrane protein TolC
VWGNTVHAQDITTLSECLRAALENNYSMQIAKNENEIVKNNYTRANAGFLPTVDAAAHYSGSLKNVASSDFAGNESKAKLQLGNGGGASVELNWDVYSGLKSQAKYAQLGELKNISDLTTRLEMENLIASVAAEYCYLVQQEQHRANLEYLLSVSRERLRIVEINYELGSRSKLELLQAKVDFNSDSSSLVQQKQQILASRIRLKTLMCELHRDKIQPDSIIRLLPTLDYNSLHEQTITANAQLQIAARQVNISAYDLKIIRANSLPYLRFNSAYNFDYNRYNKGSTKMSFNTGLAYGLTLGFNIFDGGNRRREIRNAEIARKNSELAHKETELDLRAKLQEIYSSYDNNLALVTVERQNLKTARENFDIANERYRLGELAGIDMREAQNSLLDAEKRLLDVEYNAKIDEISLMALSGNIMQYL